MSTSYRKALVWSLVAAAFIGPGTVTTAARAGTEGGWRYAAYVALAAVAGFLLMEMAARVRLVSDQPLGRVLGPGARWLSVLLFAAVVLGCAAYQAGNLLGAYGGLQLLWPAGRGWVLALGGLALAVLWRGRPAAIARALALVVAAMGILFVVAALWTVTSGQQLTGAGVVTTATVVGLVGTTIVPYNFFLASALGRGQSLPDMRAGLTGSFVVGGLITLSIVLVGSTAPAFTTFTDLARTLVQGLGGWSKGVLGFGLFAAGFSSAVTAPLAAGLAGRELVGTDRPRRWGARGRAFRLVWGGVLLVGLTVAWFGVEIIPVILAAQVVNGLLLPLVAAVVLTLANDRRVVREHVNAGWQNVAGLLVAAFLTHKSCGVLLPEAVAPLGAWLLSVVYAAGLAGAMYRVRRQ